MVNPLEGSESKLTWPQRLLLVVLGFIAALLLQYVELGPSRLEVMFDRMAKLETQQIERDKEHRERLASHQRALEEARRKNFELRLEIASLKTCIERSIEAEEIIQTLVDAHPGPGWVKRVERDKETGEVRFRMVAIDPMYELLYGKSREKYKDAFDVDVWGPKVAKGFEANDKRVLDLKTSLVSQEAWPMPSGVVRTGEAWKYYCKVRDQEYIIGFVLTTDPAVPSIGSR